MYALHSTTDMWQIDLRAKYEEKDLSDLWHDVVGWVLDCELCDLCGSWFPCAESINYPCLAPACPQLGHAGCGDLPQMRENRRHPNPRSDLPRPIHCHCRILSLLLKRREVVRLQVNSNCLLIICRGRRSSCLRKKVLLPLANPVILALNHF